MQNCEYSSIQNVFQKKKNLTDSVCQIKQMMLPPFESVLRKQTERADYVAMLWRYSYVAWLDPPSIASYMNLVRNLMLVSAGSMKCFLIILKQ